MSNRKTPGASRLALRLLPAIISGVLLTACGDSPDQMVASAKDYLAKNDPNAAVIQLKNALQTDANLPEARLMLGEIYFSRGEFANALKELNRASELGIPDQRLAGTLAPAMVQQGEGKTALERFSSIELADPKAQSRLLAALGNAHLQLQDDKAEEKFKQALSLDPQNGFASRGLAVIEVQRGNTDKALEIIGAAIALTPEDADLFGLRGQIQLSQGKTEEGLKDLKQVVTLDPKNQPAYLTLITNLIQLDRLSESGRLVADLKAAVGQTVVYSYVAAAQKAAEDDIPAAIDLIQQVIRNAPDFIPGRFLAGAIFFKANDQLQVQANLNRVIEATPKNWGARKLLVQSYIAQRDALRAVGQVEPLVRTFPEDAGVLNLAGQAYTIAGEFEKAAEAFEKASQQRPDDSKTLTRLGITRLAAGEVDEGLATLAAASAADDQNAYADFARVTTLLRAGRLDDALAAQDLLEKKLPNSALSKNLRGGLMLAAGDNAAAIKAFREALELNPDFLPAAKNLARLYIAEGKPADARQLFNDMVKRSPKRVDVHLSRIGFEIAANASKEEVLGYFKQAIEADPQAIPTQVRYADYLLSVGSNREALSVARDLQARAPDDTAVLSVLGKALLATGVSEEAVSAFQKRADRLRQNPSAYVDLAVAQARANDKKGAMRSLESALAIDPDNLTANQAYLPMLVEAGQMEKALERAKSLQRARPKLAYPHLGEAMVLRTQGKPKEALAAVRKAFELEPTTQVAISMHQMLEINGQGKEALKFEADWLGKHAGDNLYKAFAAENALQHERYERADQLYREVIKDIPNDVRIVNNLAWVAHVRKSKDALDLANRALSLAPDSPAVLDTVGVIEMAAGKVDSGLAKLERAVELAPQAMQIRYNLAEAYVGANQRDKAGITLDALIRDLPEGSQLRERAAGLRKSL